MDWGSLLNMFVTPLLATGTSLVTGWLQKHLTDIPNQAIPITNTTGMMAAGNIISNGDPVTTILAGAGGFAASLVQRRFQKSRKK